MGQHGPLRYGAWLRVPATQQERARPARLALVDHLRDVRAVLCGRDADQGCVRQPQIHVSHASLSFCSYSMRVALFAGGLPCGGLADVAFARIMGDRAAWTTAA